MLDSSNLHSHISAYFLKLPSVLWHCWLGDRKLEWWGAGGVICLELGADLHMAQLMPLLLTASCSSEIQIGFTFLIPTHLGSPGQHTHTRLTALFPGLPSWAGTRKAKPIWILLKQETVSSSGISWAICKSAPSSRQNHASTPPLNFFTGRMPFLLPNQQRQSTQGCSPGQLQLLQPFKCLFSRTTWVSRYQKGKTNLDFTGARYSEWQWHQLGDMQVCTSLQTDNHASTPPLWFWQAGCPSCCPTNSIKALNAVVQYKGLLNGCACVCVCVCVFLKLPVKIRVNCTCKQQPWPWWNGRLSTAVCLITTFSMWEWICFTVTVMVLLLFDFLAEFPKNKSSWTEMRLIFRLAVFCHDLSFRRNCRWLYNFLAEIHPRFSEISIK